MNAIRDSRSELWSDGGMDFEPTTHEPLPAPPTTIHVVDELDPRGPWSFMREAARGGLSKWALYLMAGWAAFQVLTSTAWALHLRGFASYAGGGSAMPNNWGEHLTTKDLWELAENGGLKHDPTGSLTPVFALMGLIWVLWSGWKMQGEILGFAARLRHWLLGLMDALLLGLLPLGLVYGVARWGIHSLGDTGIQGLGWLSFVGSPLFFMSFASALSLQWWICRVGRGAVARNDFHTLRHWGRSFLRLWIHPVQWSSLVLGGVALRTGLSFAALALGWRMGGGSNGRVASLLLLEVLAAALNGWLLGWFLRLTALFWRQDEKVRNARLELVRSVKAANLRESQALHES